MFENLNSVDAKRQLNNPLLKGILVSISFNPTWY